MEKLFTDLVNIGIAIVVVYLIAWALNTDPNLVVGWAALGMAATR
jgi:hypothetical protein